MTQDNTDLKHTLPDMCIPRRQLKTKMSQALTLAIVLITSSRLVAGPPLAKTVGPITFKGNIVESRDLSGVTFFSNFMVIAADEGNVVQVLEKVEDRAFEASDSRTFELPLREGDGDEVDVEGLAATTKHLFVIGSHSLKRKRVKNDTDDDESVADNFKRLNTVVREPNREWLFRYKIDDDGIPSLKSKGVSLRNLIINDPLLSTFQETPSKENGVDIEGIAIGNDGQILLGFRGPVLRGGYTPVLVLDEFDSDVDDLKYEVRFVNLRGRGIRGMCAVGDGSFLLLAGPMGDQGVSFQLYHWNGKNCVPGEGDRNAHDNAKLLCEIPSPVGLPSARPEGITMLSETEDDPMEVCVVYDLPRGATAGPTALVLQIDRK